MAIQCTVNGRVYSTAPLYFEDFTTLGVITEEKIYPLLMVLYACMKNNFDEVELFRLLYTASREAFNRDDLRLISNLVLNREHLLIDGKKLDKVEWEKHWQSVGFVEYRVVVIKFVEANLGNFTSLSALIPQLQTEELKSYITKILPILFLGLNVQK